MQDIRIDVGVCTILSINLSNVDFAGIKEVIFTVKNFADINSPVIIERRFTEPKVHEIIITPEESVKLYPNAQYDFDAVLADDRRVKLTENGGVILRRGVGDCIE